MSREQLIYLVKVANHGTPWMSRKAIETIKGLLTEAKDWRDRQLIRQALEKVQGYT